MIGGRRTRTKVIINQWEAQDSSEQYYETHEEYTAEEAHEEESAAEEQDQVDSDNFDDDDQDNYM
jgi:hypothetical protein